LAKCHKRPFKIHLFSKYGLFPGSDQRDFVFGDCIAVQLQLNQIPAAYRCNLNNSVDPRPQHVYDIIRITLHYRCLLITFLLYNQVHRYRNIV
jgi:hypothetical protein